jgi:hypothetical protein
MATLEQSTFQRRPAYKYLRTSDKLLSTEAARMADDPIARVKLFDPTGSWTWYVAGYDAETHLAWGVVDGFEKELGDFDMRELVALRGRGGLPVERDLYWKPTPISELLANERRAQ